jgi:hypothetical protein
MFHEVSVKLGVFNDMGKSRFSMLDAGYWSNDGCNEPRESRTISIEVPPLLEREGDRGRVFSRADRRATRISNL